MLHLATLAGSLLLAGAAPQLPDTTPPSLPDSVARSVTLNVAPAEDTIRPKKRAVAVEYSEWYGRRLTVHRWASYTMLPLFAGNYVTGDQLLKYGNLAPSWATQTHGPLATGVASLFALNTLTGGWNLWDGRSDPSARAWRTTHSLLMLAADAGFTATGILSREGQRSDRLRRLHRTVALGSIGVSLFSYGMMLSPFRRD